MVPAAASGSAEASEPVASEVVAPEEGARVAAVGLPAAATARPGTANNTCSSAESHTQNGLSIY